MRATHLFRVVAVLAALAASTIAAPIALAGSTTRTVGTCPHATYSTIQLAVTASAAGDKIMVCAGTYPEQVLIPAGKNGLTLQSITKLAAVIQAPAAMASPKAIVEVTTSQNVTIQDFTITGPGVGGCDSIEYGVRIDGGASATITGNHITHIRDNPLGGCQNGNAVQIGRAAELTTGSANVKNNQIDDYQKTGIIVSNTGSSANIENNTITGVGSTALIAQNGIQVSGGANASVKGNKVSGNVYTGTENAVSTGILLFAPGAVTIENNKVSANDVNIFDFQSTTAVSIKNNETSGGTFDGIDIVSSSGATVESNKSHNNVFDGIYLQDTGSGNTIKSNTLASNGEDGINLDQTTDPTPLAATNNSVRDNHATGSGRDGVHASIDSTGNTIQNNSASSSGTFDCHDLSTTGTGTNGTGNFWLSDHGVTFSPAGICKK